MRALASAEELESVHPRDAGLAAAANGGRGQDGRQHRGPSSGTQGGAQGRALYRPDGTRITGTSVPSQAGTTGPLPPAFS